MEITWLGHSCFRLKGNQAIVVTDPYPPELGYNAGKLSANIITVSHQHPSHSYTQGVGGNWKLVKGPGEYEIGGVLIIGIPTFHDDRRGGERGKNTVYLFEVDGVTVCHLGDLGHTLSAEQIEELGQVDVLLVPVGGSSTIGAETAAEIIRRVEPQTVIPMHYGTPAVNRELAPVERFLKEMGLETVEPRPRLSVTRSTLPSALQVVVLDYRALIP